jgi:hypothetical protein
VHGEDRLLLIFSAPNQFEACCVVDTKYYAVWPKMKEDSDYAILRRLRALGVMQRWMFYDGIDERFYPCYEQAVQWVDIP